MKTLLKIAKEINKYEAAVALGYRSNPQTKKMMEGTSKSSRLAGGLTGAALGAGLGAATGIATRNPKGIARHMAAGTLAGGALGALGARSIHDNEARFAQNLHKRTKHLTDAQLHEIAETPRDRR